MTSYQLKCLSSLTVLESLTVSDSLLQFGPELVLVSAGFDAALGDPLVCEPVVRVVASCVYQEETIMSTVLGKFKMFIFTPEENCWTF